MAGRPQSPLKFCREARKYIDDPTWAVFCVDDPRNPVPVDLEQVENTPGRYELRHNDTVYFQTMVGIAAGMFQDDDALVIQARSVKRATDGALDSLLSQNDRLQAEIARERERSVLIQKDADRVREENHSLRHEMQKMVIEHMDSERTDAWIEEGVKLVREGMYAWQAKDFMDQLKARMAVAMPLLDAEDRKMAVHLFEKLNKIDAFRLPALPAEEASPQKH